MKYDYNLIVIGAGAGGLVSAYLASASKAKSCFDRKASNGRGLLEYWVCP